MPIYDYACESCGNVVEVIHPISAPGPSTCELCGGRLKRALSAPAIVFKGSGWAKKDARDASRSKTKPAAAVGASDAAAPATSEATGASDAKGTSGGTEAAAAPSGTPAPTAAKPTVPSGGGGATGT